MNKIIRITTVPVSLRVLLRDQLKFVSSHYNVIAVSSSGADLKKLSEEQQVEVKAVDMTRKITPLKDLMALWQLYILFKKEAPLIVHTHTPKAGTLGMMAAKLAGVPIRIHTVAGMPLLEEKGMKRKLLDMVEKITYACAHEVYPNSFCLRDIIEQQALCKPEKLKVIANGSSNGINTSFFNPDLFSEQEKQALKKELNIPSADIVFCFVGRLVKDKGINELVNVFEELSRQYADITLLLVGPFERDLDPLNEETEKIMDKHPKIKTVGQKEDVRPYFAISDVFVFPSYREGFPNVVMQAGAMGLPCVVSDINGCNEIISNHINGLIIPVKNAPALKGAMEELLLNTTLREKMAAVAREMIVSRFEQHHVWNELLKEYQLLEEKLMQQKHKKALA